MGKLAIFVEGQTELILLRKLLEELAGKKNIHFELRDYVSDRHVVLAASHGEVGAVAHYVLLFDCRGDSNVKSAIVDRLTSLEAAGYDLILGLRDLFPFRAVDLPRLEQGVSVGMPVSAIPIHVLIAVHEVEAWFLQEEGHYQRVCPTLVPDTFAPIVGFHPRLDSAEAVYHPSKLLHTIYQTAGRAYNKKRANVERTVDAIDVASFCFELPARVPSLERVVRIIDTFLGW